MKHSNNNVHVAYLRLIKQTLSIRKRRFRAAAGMRASHDPRDLTRHWNKLDACQRWEDTHGAIL